MPIDSALQAWWLEPLSAGTADLATVATGLSGAEAKARLARFGPNLFRERQDRSLLLQYLARFKNPLVVILLIASAVSASTGEVTNFLIITCIVLLSVTLDFLQEYRANAAAEKLRQSGSVLATVLRDVSATVLAAAGTALCVRRVGRLRAQPSAVGRGGRVEAHHDVLRDDERAFTLLVWSGFARSPRAALLR